MKMKDTGIMEKDIERPAFLTVSEMYREICKKSAGSQPGLSIKEIKKKYHLKQRDIKVLVDTMQDINTAVYQILTPNEAEKMDEPSEDLEKETLKSNEEDEDNDKLENDNYLWIGDMVDIIREKINENELDIKNTTLMKELHRRFLNSNTSIWSERGDRLLKTATYMIDRLEDDENLSGRNREMRRNMVQAIVMKKKLHFSAGSGLMEVSPKGIYYNKVLGCYYLICQNENGKYEEYAVANAKIAKILPNKTQTDSDDFDIKEYLNTTRTRCVKVRIYYREGNVLKKFCELFSDHQCQEMERNSEYCVMSFMVDQYEPYEMILDGYGQSVIVMEPEGLRDDMLKRAQNVKQIWSS